MAKTSKDAPEIVCMKCGAVVTAKMLSGKPKKCPACGEPDFRFFDFDKSDWSSGIYPLGEEEEST